MSAANEFQDFGVRVDQARARLGPFPALSCPPRPWAISDRPLRAIVRVNATIRRRRLVHRRKDDR